MVLDDDDGKRDRKGVTASAVASGSRHTSSSKRKAPAPRSMFLPLFGFHSTVGRSTGGGSGRDKDRDRDRDRHGERERARDRESVRERDSNRHVYPKHRDRDRDRERSSDGIRDRPSHRHHPGRHSDSHIESRAAAANSPPSAARTRPQPPPKPVRVELKSLDSGQHDWTVLLHQGYPLMKLEQVIRQNFEKRRRPLDSAALFRFFASDSREFTREDKVTKDVHQVWYRVSRFSGQVESWKFTHYQDDTHGRLDSGFTEELVRDINGGATVKQLRRKIAERWDIEDANRVLLIAKGGFRPGSIKGDCWEVRQIKEKWLCRWIAIDVCPRKRYIVLKGLKREYIFHPDDRSHLDMAGVKTMMCDKLFRSVRQHGKSDFNLPSRRITLTRHDGGTARNTHPLVWGAEYMFELPYHEAEVFSDEETWLLPATETCMICIDDKRITELPVRITAECKHEPTTCKPCLEQWLQSSLESGTWDRLKCPECPELLKHADVQRYASKATFTRYDDLATRAALKDMPNFRWCLSTTCESGQIDDETCAKFKCKECKNSHCIKHNVPWHKGETCEEYDKRNKKRLKDEKASEDMIKKTSKKCPECKKDVHKYTGCNHITCVCGHEWCYICFAKFERNHVGFLFCRHLPTCTERDPFIDLIDNPPPDPLNLNNNNNNGNRNRPRGVFPGIPAHVQHLRAGRRQQARAPIPPPPFPPAPDAPQGAGPPPVPDLWNAWAEFGRPRERPRVPPGGQAAPNGLGPAPLFIGAVNVLTNQINDLANNLQEAVNQQVNNQANQQNQNQNQNQNQGFPWPNAAPRFGGGPFLADLPPVRPNIRGWGGRIG